VSHFALVQHSTASMAPTEITALTETNVISRGFDTKYQKKTWPTVLQLTSMPSVVHF